MNKERARCEKSRRRNIVGTPLKSNIAQAQDQQLNSSCFRIFVPTLPSQH